VAKRLKERKEKATLTESQSSKATKKKAGVGPEEGKNKISVPETKKRPYKRKEVSKNEYDYDVQ